MYGVLSRKGLIGISKKAISQVDHRHIKRGEYLHFPRKQSFSDNLTVTKIAYNCRKLKDDFGLDMIVIDDYGSIRGNNVMLDLKKLAMELDVPILMTVHLNYLQISQRPDKRPSLRDLCAVDETLYRYANKVLLLHQDTRFNPMSNLSGIAEVIIAKNYSGGLTNEKLAYQPEFKAFQNLYVDEDA